jgi:hypothetical protein
MRLATTRLTPLSRVVYLIADFRQEGYIKEMCRGPFQLWERRRGVPVFEVKNRGFLRLLSETS